MAEASRHWPALCSDCKGKCLKRPARVPHQTVSCGKMFLNPTKALMLPPLILIDTCFITQK